MRVKIHPLADDEVVESAKHYERIQEGWGDRFLDEFNSSIKRILEAPDRWPVREHGFRKYTIQEFSHTIRYTVRGDLVYVIEAPHSSREPGYWKDRILDEQR